MNSIAYINVKLGPITLGYFQTFKPFKKEYYLISGNMLSTKWLKIKGNRINNNIFKGMEDNSYQLSL